MTSLTPDSPRPRSHSRNPFQDSLDSVNPSAQPTISQRPSEFTPMATIAATFSWDPPQLRFRYMPSTNRHGYDLCQVFGHGSSRNYAAMGSPSSACLVRSKNESMTCAGTW